MDFDLTDDQLALRDAVVRFAHGELNDGVPGRDRSHTFSPEAWKRCASFGLTGLHVPVEYGGQGADPVTVAVTLDGLGYGCEDNGLLFSLSAHLWSAVTPVLRFGTERQKQRYLPGMCDGSIIGVQGMTEPGSGSDAFALTTTVTDRGNRLVLRGSKTYVSNAPVADVFVVFATADRSAGWTGVSAVLVDRGTPGLTVGPPFEKMGLHTSPMAELAFDDCEVPADNRLGPAGAGLSIFTHSMDWERSFILATAIGTMQRQLERSIAYARQREQFGRPIGSFQAVSHRIVEMKARLETSRLLMYRLAWLRAQGRPTRLEASLVKWLVSEHWIANSLDAQQVHGAFGYMADAGLERDVRDALASRIYSGTSDIQKNLVAGGLGL